MEVSDQHNAPASLHLTEMFLVPTEQEARWAPEAVGAQKTLLSCWESNHDSSIVQPTA
jgi:hypothetical protein